MAWSNRVPATPRRCGRSSGLISRLNHLAVLRNVGLLVDERRGTQIFYTLKNPCGLIICGCLDEFHANAGA